MHFYIMYITYVQVLLQLLCFSNTSAAWFIELFIIVQSNVIFEVYVNSSPETQVIFFFQNASLCLSELSYPVSATPWFIQFPNIYTSSLQGSSCCFPILQFSDHFKILITLDFVGLIASLSISNHFLNMAITSSKPGILLQSYCYIIGVCPYEKLLLDLCDHSIYVNIKQTRGYS